MDKFRLGIASVLMTASPFALAHGGGLNADGCHNNHQTGEYHCHRAPIPKADARAWMISPPSVPNKHATLRTTDPISRPSVVPTCHVGPRGGTYTITESGRKNYGGC